VNVRVKSGRGETMASVHGGSDRVENDHVEIFREIFLENVHVASEPTGIFLEIFLAILVEEICAEIDGGIYLLGIYLSEIYHVGIGSVEIYRVNGKGETCHEESGETQAIDHAEIYETEENGHVICSSAICCPVHRVIYHVIACLRHEENVYLGNVKTAPKAIFD